VNDEELMFLYSKAKISNSIEFIHQIVGILEENGKYKHAKALSWRGMYFVMNENGDASNNLKMNMLQGRADAYLCL